MNVNGYPWEQRKIGFDTVLKGLKAFTAHFDNKVSEIHNNIPVYFMNTGDETYYNKKFEVIDGGIQEIYKSNPRIILKIDTADLDFDTKGGTANIKYNFDNKLYQADFKHTNLGIPVVVNMVTPNFIFGFQYFEMLMTIFNDINVFSYMQMSNSLEGKYVNKSYNFEFPPIEPGSTAKNFIINFAIDLALPIYLSRYRTIQKLNHETGKIDGINDIQFGIDPVSVSSEHTIPIIKMDNYTECCTDCVAPKIIIP